jgi:hypothetical protein
VLYTTKCSHTYAGVVKTRWCDKHNSSSSSGSSTRSGVLLHVTATAVVAAMEYYYIAKRVTVVIAHELRCSGIQCESIMCTSDIRRIMQCAYMYAQSVYLCMCWLDLLRLLLYRLWWLRNANRIACTRQYVAARKQKTSEVQPYVQFANRRF